MCEAICKLRKKYVVSGILEVGYSFFFHIVAPVRKMECRRGEL
jgi:hypothetical protein